MGDQKNKQRDSVPWWVILFFGLIAFSLLGHLVVFLSTWADMGFDHARKTAPVGMVTITLIMVIGYLIFAVKFSDRGHSGVTWILLILLAVFALSPLARCSTQDRYDYYREPGVGFR